MSYLRRILLQSSRRFSTSRVCLRPALSADYKSKDLWEDRFHCELLADQSLIKSINTKILSDLKLTNLEVDVFINIAAPRKDDLSQLQEAAKTLRVFRKSLYAHTLLPSTSHAVCRLFLDSNKLSTLVKILEKRIEFGIFPDHFALNLLFDRALEQEQYVVASRIGTLIMLQEEFGLNPLNDNFALYSIAKYIESKPDFSHWIQDASAADPILDPSQEGEPASQTSESRQQGKEETANNEEEDDGEEDEDDAEYIRVPFLRNPYHDNHFDLTNPRQICGKTLSMLAMNLQNGEPKLSVKCRALGDILQGKWTDANEALTVCLQSKVSVDDNFSNTVTFYLENLHELKGADDQTRQSILSKLDKLPRGGASLSDEAETRHTKLGDLEREGIEQLRQDLKEWSNIRFTTRKAIQDLEAKKRLVEEIKAKKRELEHREKYLFFYENLKKNNLGRINYD